MRDRDECFRRAIRAKCPPGVTILPAVAADRPLTTAPMFVGCREARISTVNLVAALRIRRSLQAQPGAKSLTP